MENPDIVIVAEFNTPLAMHCCNKHLKCEADCIWSKNGELFISVRCVGSYYLSGSNCQKPLKDMKLEQQLLKKGVKQ